MLAWRSTGEQSRAKFLLSHNRSLIQRQNGSAEASRIALAKDVQTVRSRPDNAMACKKVFVMCSISIKRSICGATSFLLAIVALQVAAQDQEPAPRLDSRMNKFYQQEWSRSLMGRGIRPVLGINEKLPPGGRFRPTGRRTSGRAVATSPRYQTKYESVRSF